MSIPENPASYTSWKEHFKNEQNLGHLDETQLEQLGKAKADSHLHLKIARFFKGGDYDLEKGRRALNKQRWKILVAQGYTNPDKSLWFKKVDSDQPAISQEEQQFLEKGKFSSKKNELIEDLFAINHELITIAEDLDVHPETFEDVVTTQLFPKFSSQGTCHGKRKDLGDHLKTLHRGVNLTNPRPGQALENEITDLTKFMDVVKGHKQLFGETEEQQDKAIKVAIAGGSDTKSKTQLLRRAVILKMSEPCVAEVQKELGAVNAQKVAQQFQNDAKRIAELEEPIGPLKDLNKYQANWEEGVQWLKTLRNTTDDTLFNRVLEGFETLNLADNDSRERVGASIARQKLATAMESDLEALSSSRMKKRYGEFTTSRQQKELRSQQAELREPISSQRSKIEKRLKEFSFEPKSIKDLASRKKKLSSEVEKFKGKYRDYEAELTKAEETLKAAEEHLKETPPDKPKNSILSFFATDTPEEKAVKKAQSELETIREEFIKTQELEKIVGTLQELEMVELALHTNQEKVKEYQKRIDDVIEEGEKHLEGKTDAEIQHLLAEELALSTVDLFLDANQDINVARRQFFGLVATNPTKALSQLREKQGLILQDLPDSLRNAAEKELRECTTPEHFVTTIHQYQHYSAWQQLLVKEFPSEIVTPMMEANYIHLLCFHPAMSQDARNTAFRLFEIANKLSKEDNFSSEVVVSATTKFVEETRRGDTGLSAMERLENAKESKSGGAKREAQVRSRCKAVFIQSTAAEKIKSPNQQRRLRQDLLTMFERRETLNTKERNFVVDYIAAAAPLLEQYDYDIVAETFKDYLEGWNVGDLKKPEGEARQFEAASLKEIAAKHAKDRNSSIDLERLIKTLEEDPIRFVQVIGTLLEPANLEHKEDLEKLLNGLQVALKDTEKLNGLKAALSALKQKQALQAAIGLTKESGITADVIFKNLTKVVLGSVNRGVETNRTKIEKLSATEELRSVKQWREALAADNLSVQASERTSDQIVADALVVPFAQGLLVLRFKTALAEEEKALKILDNTPIQLNFDDQKVVVETIEKLQAELAVKYKASPEQAKPLIIELETQRTKLSDLKEQMKATIKEQRDSLPERDQKKLDAYERAYQTRWDLQKRCDDGLKGSQNVGVALSNALLLIGRNRGKFKLAIGASGGAGALVQFFGEPLAKKLCYGIFEKVAGDPELAAKLTQEHSDQLLQVGVEILMKTVTHLKEKKQFDAFIELAQDVKYTTEGGRSKNYQVKSDEQIVLALLNFTQTVAAQIEIYASEIGGQDLVNTIQKGQ